MLSDCKIYRRALLNICIQNSISSFDLTFDPMMHQASRYNLRLRWTCFLTSWLPKLTVSWSGPADYFCQFPSKSLHVFICDKSTHSFSKYCIQNFGNRRTDGRTNVDSPVVIGGRKGEGLEPPPKVWATPPKPTLPGRLGPIFHAPSDTPHSLLHNVVPTLIHVSRIITPAV